MIGIITEAAPLVLSGTAPPLVTVSYGSGAPTDFALEISRLLASTDAKSNEDGEFSQLDTWFAKTALGRFK